MSDNDLIRRGDALAEIRRIFNGYPNWVTDAIAALPPAKQDDLASGKAVTVRVKPLGWKPDAMKGSYPDRLRAVMPCGSGDYSVAGSKKQDKWQWFRNGYFVDGHQLHDPMPLEAAKAAAQADYEVRILAALEPVAAPRRYMGQIMAECDCSRQGECEAAQKCLAVAAPDPAAIREAIWSAFIAGCGQGSDEATSFEWGSTAQQTRQQAFDDFMAEWNKDSAPLRALISKGAAEPTEYERKVAQMKKDFPNGI